MDVEMCISAMNKVIDLDFEQRKPIFEKYKSILEEEISHNPDNVDAICLLGMVLCELRYDTEVSLDYLQNCYDKFAPTLSDDRFTLLVTNLAYFYLEECDEMEEKSIEMLKLAVAKSSKYPDTYYALAKALFIKKNYEEAANYFNKAYEITKDKRYKYCEAVSLFYHGDIKTSIDLLYRSYSKVFCNEYDIRIGLTLATLLAINGQNDRAKEISDDLLTAEIDDINAFEVADIMFLIGDYERCATLFEKEYLSAAASWLGEYYYSLKHSSQIEKAQLKFNQLCECIQQDILEEQKNPQEWDSPEELEEYIEREKKRLKSIENCFRQVFEHNEKPAFKFEPYILSWCYYINCPRHYKL